ncbi:anti-sigma factor [Sphingomonas sp. R-74633]|uniref:anti-sigma factor family protein n=1 Tax=Sphingomonas sp. R-74633 TaxID=2751188 RepID=UPI0015D1DA88|nr:anti-sigma factor [Sphingomonas sp. R-74633]NYT39342.1 anti-sigma factor [Sphingomonas sp. R-74633]
MTSHPEPALIHAYADGELDAANTVSLEAHLKTCPECRAQLDEIEAVRALMAAAPRTEASPELRGRIEAMLDAEVPKPARAGLFGHIASGRWASGALTGAIAASLALLVAAPQLTRSDTEDQLVQSHVRSLIAGHVVDIATSNRHVVKPWFNGRIDFAPPVPELAAQGFPLVGGRMDYIEDKPAAAIVYKRALHTINLFVRPAAGLSLPGASAVRHKGYSLVRWTNGGLEYWAVSDVDPNDLQLFRQAYQGATSAR